jgi:hypothetical protein
MDSCKNCIYCEKIYHKDSGMLELRCPIRCSSGKSGSFNGDYRPCINYEIKKGE